MAFGVRNNPVPGGDPAQFWACPLCAATFEDKNDFVNHLVNVHGMSRKDANALVR